MIKNSQLDFASLQHLDLFYDSKFEQDKDVRNMWYIFCFNFLSKINKDWNNCLQPSRLRKKTFLFDHITTSDEAMTQWFIKHWEPKIKEQQENGWPPMEKSRGEGDHELKAGQKDYVALYQKILQSKTIENGELACRWNDIFWEEMESNHPIAFIEDQAQSTTAVMNESKSNLNEEIIVLPDIDDENIFLDLTKKRKSANIISSDIVQLPMMTNESNINEEGINNITNARQSSNFDLEEDGINSETIPTHPV